jgi:hypothetical protein
VLSPANRGWLLLLVRLHLLVLRLSVLLLTVLGLRVWLRLLPSLPGRRRPALLLSGIVLWRLPSGHADSPMVVQTHNVMERR